MISSLADERVIDVNNEFLTLSEFERDVIGGKTENLNLWVHPEQRTDVYSKLLKSGSLRNLDAELKTKSGQVKHILMSAEVITINDEPRVLFSAQDITDLKKTQEALHAFRQQTLLQMVSDGLHILDENGNVLEANDSFCKLLGYTRQELLNMNVADWDVKFSKEELLIRIGEFIDNPRSFTTKHRARDGRIWDVEINTAVIAIGSRKCLCASARDITLRKSEESRLRESEEIFHTINNTSPDAIVLLDLNATIILANPAACEIFGYESVLQMIGNNILDLFIVEDRIKAFEMLQQISIEGMVRNVEYSFLRKNGTSYYCEFSCSTLYDTDGKPRGLLSVTHDITERRHLEDELCRTNLELQRRNAEKDKFFSIIAHDLRSPFTGLLGFTKMMTSEDNILSIEEYANLSKLVRDSVVNLYKLVENLLEWAMFQKGASDFIPIEFGLSEMFIGSIDSIKERARQKGIAIFHESDGIDKIYADEKMISTILRNLLANAVKFTRKGGNVTVRAKETIDGMIEISVTDTGVGIHKDMIDKLFILGEKVGTTGTEGEPSTGLGLILCKEFVEKHNGKIWVESRKNVGSTFYFTVPKAINDKL